jgi:peptidylprolyl isomerase
MADTEGTDVPPAEEKVIDPEAIQRAMEAKERAAECYKAGDHQEAKTLWLEALLEIPQTQEADAEVTRLLLSLRLNLAMAGLQLKEYDQVFEHATHALRYAPDNAKALYRRGIAGEALGRIQQAAVDMQNAARLEPKNGDIRKRYESLKRQVQELKFREGDDVEEPPPIHDASSCPRAYLEVKVGDADAVRLLFALYYDTAPKTAENFRQLCTGEHPGLTGRKKPFNYSGSIFHRMIPGLMVQGGDFELANGCGGESIYGRRFPDECLRDKFTRRGLLAMANDGPNTNGSNFFVSLAAAEHLDRHHVVFGEVIGGMDFLNVLEKLETDEECRPLVDCVITACGADARAPA